MTKKYTYKYLQTIEVVHQRIQKNTYYKVNCISKLSGSRLQEILPTSGTLKYSVHRKWRPIFIYIYIYIVHLVQSSALQLEYDTIGDRAANVLFDENVPRQCQHMNIPLEGLPVLYCIGLNSKTLRKERHVYWPSEEGHRKHGVRPKWHPTQYTTFDHQAHGFLAEV